MRYPGLHYAQLRAAPFRSALVTAFQAAAQAAGVSAQSLLRLRFYPGSIVVRAIASDSTALDNLTQAVTGGAMALALPGMFAGVVDKRAKRYRGR